MKEFIKKYYAVLELEEDASLDEIKEARKTLIKVWHPDRFVNDKKLKDKAESKIKEINNAYSTLLEYHRLLENDFKIEESDASYSKEQRKDSTTQSQKQNQKSKHQKNADDRTHKEQTGQEQHNEPLYYRGEGLRIVLYILILLALIILGGLEQKGVKINCAINPSYQGFKYE